MCNIVEEITYDIVKVFTKFSKLEQVLRLIINVLCT